MNNEVADDAGRELQQALRRMRRSLVLRLGSKMGYSISVPEAENVVDSPTGLSESFSALQRQHRFDLLKRPWRLFWR
jgi:hypothetical protein